MIFFIRKFSAALDLRQVSLKNEIKEQKRKLEEGLGREKKWVAKDLDDEKRKVQETLERLD